MKHRLTRLAMLAALIFPVGFVISAAAAEPLTCLRSQGRDIVNEKGDKVLLRGVGLGNWMLPEGYMWKFGSQGDRPRRIEKIVSSLIGPEEAQRFWTAFRSNYITEADIHRIAELGFNSVRPALNSRLFLSDDGKPDTSAEGFRLLDHLIGWCASKGIYVIIDMHAAPGGQTGSNIDDSANDKPELFMEPRFQDELVELWTTIVNRYKNQPAVAGYDLLNEPLPERTGAAEAYKSQLEPLYRRITQAIRKIDSRHMIILEGADWANDWSVFSTPFDSNLVYQFHYYAWNNPDHVNGITKFLDFQSRHNIPIWAGETGEKNNAIYWASTELFEANNVGWCFWPWKKLDAQNAPCSIPLPAHWDAISAVSRGGKPPEKELALAILNTFLENIKLANCRFYPEVVNSLLRQAPARIEAENYGRAGQDQSFFLKDAGKSSAFYRTSEPVPIHLSETNRWQSSQFISLVADEWTAYTIRAPQSREFHLSIKARGTNKSASAQLTIGNEKKSVTFQDQTWRVIDLGNVTLNGPSTPIKWQIIEGSADLDWIEFTGPTSASLLDSPRPYHAAP